MTLGTCLFGQDKAQPCSLHSESSRLVCCSGWGQLGDECLTPLCEGNFTCKENEVCVRPNECRCRHGYFGAS
ncbi:Scavenger receptor class F member 2, partial [Goodea atripinnis]